MSVEVERKFICNADVLETLEKFGVRVGQRQFRDQYFDTPEFRLTLRDLWLRKRKGCWELKCPVETVDGTEEPSGERSLCTRYKEVTNLPEIYKKVLEVLKDACKDGESAPSQEEEDDDDDDDDDSWLGKLNLVCFAAFTTVRQSFTLEEEGVQIDLDQADFGYHVGEIEVLVPEGGDVRSAQEKIRNAAQRLGLVGDERVEGKMNVYLKRNHPEHYAKLLSAHVL